MDLLRTFKVYEKLKELSEEYESITGNKLNIEIGSNDFKVTLLNTIIEISPSMIPKNVRKTVIHRFLIQNDKDYLYCIQPLIITKNPRNLIDTSNQFRNTIKNGIYLFKDHDDQVTTMILKSDTEVKELEEIYQ